MDVTVIGCGYVGLVTGTCLASIGHTVRGVEKDLKKLKTLQDGHCPISEPGGQAGPQLTRRRARRLADLMILRDPSAGAAG